MPNIKLETRNRFFWDLFFFWGVLLVNLTFQMTELHIPSYLIVQITDREDLVDATCQPVEVCSSLRLKSMSWLSTCCYAAVKNYQKTASFSQRNYQQDAYTHSQLLPVFATAGAQLFASGSGARHDQTPSG